jgi:hypothetical protein
MKPGPAFKTSYDNKYKDWDVFAHDDGRYKAALNTNKHDENVLKSAERSKYFGNLKLSSIKFDQDEMGSPLKAVDKLNKTLTPTGIQMSPTSNKDYSTQEQTSSFYNKKTSAVTNVADHQSGEIVGGTRSQTSHQRERSRQP